MKISSNFKNSILRLVTGVLITTFALISNFTLNGQSRNERDLHLKNNPENSFNKISCPGIFFENVGDLPGDCISSVPSDISSDGKQVTINSSADDPNVPNDGGSCDPWLGWPHSNQAAGWTRPCKGKSFFNNTANSGIVGFGYLSGGTAPHAESLARGISPDGKVVAGYSNYKSDNNTKAVVFTGSGIQELALLDSGCIAIDVSQRFLGPQNSFTDAALKGRVIVGYSNINNQYALRLPGAKAVYWDNLNHVVELPLPTILPNDSIVISSEAVSISDNGEFIVGNLYYNQKMNPQHYMSFGCVWYYNPQNQWQNRYDLLCVLEDLPGGDNNAKVNCISGNGQVIVGIGSQYSGDPSCWDYINTACKWEVSGIFSNPICSSGIALPALSGYGGSAAFGTNFEGSVIVGSATNIIGTCTYPEFDTRPTRWITCSQNQNPEDIWSVMNEFIPENWILFDAIRVSADGNTVIGYGIDYDYNIVGWVAGLPSATNQFKEEVSSMYNQDFTIFPNPASRMTKLNCYSENTSPYSIIITDMSGKVVDRISSNAIEGINTIEIDLHQFKSGVYYIQYLQNDKQFLQKLVVEK